MTNQADSRAPTVVVAMPTYNHALFIAEAVESVIAQRFQAWELVIVDDGSTDGTLEIVRRVRDVRIKVIARAHQGLAGLGATYRTILEQSTAPLVAILEGDDRWPPDKLSRQVPDFDDHAVVLSYGAGGLIDLYSCEYGRVDPFFPAEIRTNRPVGAILPGLLAGNPILSPTVVVRRAALDAVGGFWQPDGVPYVDHPTWLLLAIKGAFAYHTAIVGYWRRHPAQWATRVVRSAEVEIPEASYISRISDQVAVQTDRPRLALPPLHVLVRGHRDRALLNRWRLALLAGTWADVGISFRDLVGSRSPRLVALGCLGLGMRAIGVDLEWLQRWRHRVSWPSRRHVRRHGEASKGTPTPT